jgi:hypothetical protein
MQKIAIGLVVLVVMCGSATLALATGGGGSSHHHGGAVSIQYKKKALCKLLLWVYNSHYSHNSNTRIATPYGYYYLKELVKLCYAYHP